MLSISRLLVLATGIFPGVLAAQSSTFEAGSAEGWISVTLAYPSPGVPPVEIAPPPVSPSVVSTGGNPGGFVRVVDPDGTWPVGNTQYWKAPAGFLGNRSDHLGGEISFDVLLTTNLGWFDEEDIVLTGGGMTISWFAGVQPQVNVWTHLAASLAPGSWHVGNRFGPLATAADLATVLGALGTMYLRGEFQLGPDVMGLDNVAFVPAASTQAFGAGCGGTGYPAPVLVALGSPVLGANFALQTISSTALGVGAFLFATTSLPGVDLTFLGMPGCFLYVPLDFVDAVGVSGGVMQDQVPIPNVPTLAGVHLFVQSAVLAPVNPFGMVLSGAVDGVLGR